MWLSSRGAIAIVLLLIAPLLPAPPGGIQATAGVEVFSAWDSVHYEKIAASGYPGVGAGVGTGEEYLLAFFPLFPLLMRAIANLGLSVPMAGILVNNLAFLGALLILYSWVEKRHDSLTARWATAALAWHPFSLFATVIYSEGLFLLWSAAALRAFDAKQYGRVSLWGALATATRPTGVALIPAFLFAAWKERRPPLAYLASLAASGGLLLFALYCWIHVSNPLAFVEAQRAWRPSSGFDWQGWWKILMQIAIGQANVSKGLISEPWHPLLMVLVAAIGCGLWRFRDRLSASKVGFGTCVLVLLLWLLGGDPLINAVSIFGSGYLLWCLRGELAEIALVYGFCGLGLILASGSTISLGRIAWGILPISYALGVLIARAPRWGYPTMVFFGILLLSLAVRFAQHLWAG